MQAARILDGEKPSEDRSPFILDAFSLRPSHKQMPEAVGFEDFLLIVSRVSRPLTTACGK